MEFKRKLLYRTTKFKNSFYEKLALAQELELINSSFVPFNGVGLKVFISPENQVDSCEFKSIYISMKNSFLIARNSEWSSAHPLTHQ